MGLKRAVKDFWSWWMISNLPSRANPWRGIGRTSPEGDFQKFSLPLWNERATKGKRMGLPPLILVGFWRSADSGQ